MRTARRVRVRVRYTSRILLGPRRMRSPPTGQALPANGDAQACRRRRWRTITARAWPGRSSGPFALTLNGECACSVAAIGLRAVRPPWFARSGRRGWTPCARPLWSSAGAARKAARSGRLRQASFCVCSSRPRGSFHCDRTSRCHRRGSLAHSTGLMTYPAQSLARFPRLSTRIRAPSMWPDCGSLTVAVRTSRLLSRFGRRPGVATLDPPSAVGLNEIQKEAAMARVRVGGA